MVFLNGPTITSISGRAGYGTSANPTRYPIVTLILDTQTFTKDGSFVIGNTSGARLGNPNLKPERIDELEFGLEGRFLNSRLSVDLSLYRKITKDLIVLRPLDPSTGYTNTQTNVGKIKNDGVELDLVMNWLDSANWSWNTNVNWSTNDAIVQDLGQDGYLLWIF